MILTDVDKVYLHFGTKKQRGMKIIRVEQARQYLEEGHFPPGSMGPKIEAIISFLKTGGKRGLITNPASLNEALDGRAGTHFVGKI